MKPTTTLHDLGQSLWLDNVTRALLSSGTLQRYIAELSVTGLTSNPTIFDHAIKNSADYDADIAGKASSARSHEDLFFELALADLTQAADMFRPTFERTDGVSTNAAANPTFSSRFPGPGRACPPSRRQSLPASRSTSRCCSPASSIWQRPTPICAALSGASRRG
jgi:hypothetical protein